MNKGIKKLAATGMLMAMIFVLTAFLKIPLASGYFHIGDSLLYIGALIFGGPVAIIAGALGEGFADLAGGYAVYFLPTVIIKSLSAVPFFFVKKDKLFSAKTVLLSAVAGLINIAGYFVADMIIARAYAFVDIPGNILQAVASVAIFAAIAAAFDKSDIKNKIDF